MQCDAPSIDDCNMEVSWSTCVIRRSPPTWMSPGRILSKRRPEVVCWNWLNDDSSQLDTVPALRASRRCTDLVAILYVRTWTRESVLRHYKPACQGNRTSPWAYAAKCHRQPSTGRQNRKISVRERGKGKCVTRSTILNHICYQPCLAMHMSHWSSSVAVAWCETCCRVRETVSLFVLRYLLFESENLLANCM